MAIRLETFRAEAPRLAPRALPNEMAQEVVNARLLSGDLGVWKDIGNVHALDKSGPIITVYPFVDNDGRLYWFNWMQSELRGGSTQVNAARVPIINDPTVRTVFTGTALGPQITDRAIAVNPDVGSYGPYPDGSANLAVLAPLDPPTVANVPSGPGNNVSSVEYTTQTLGGVGFTGAYGFVTVKTVDTQTDIPLPAYEFRAQQPHSTYVATTGFALKSSASFTVEFDCASTNNTDLIEDQIAVFQIVSSGTLDGSGNPTAIGAELRLGFTGNSGGLITWTDKAGATAPVTIGPDLLVPANPVHVVISAVNNNDSTTAPTFTVSVTVTDLTTHAVVGSHANLTATWAGEQFFLAGIEGDNDPDTGLVFFGHIQISVAQAPSSVPTVFSNYVYTGATQLQLESAPSPASTPVVQVDNDNTNYVTIPAQAASVAEVFLYRAATGSSGTQYLQVVNGQTSDGGFALCAAAVVGGDPNTLALTDPVHDGPPQQDTCYFFIAPGTNTGPVSIGLNGAAAVQVRHADQTPLGAGDLVSGRCYSVAFAQTIVQPATQAATRGQSSFSVASTAGIAVGDVVTDAAGVVPPGATVASLAAGTVTISTVGNTGITADMASGNLLFFASSSNGYTLVLATNATSGWTFRDTTATADLGVPLPSADWDPPPDDMVNVTALPNGIIAGSSGNTLLLSVQGQPHAYPLSYQLATDSPIVALVALDANIAILTQGHPYTAYGTTPSAFTMTKETFLQGCVSARSASYLRGFGAVYASTDGVYAYGGLGQIRNLTENLFTLQEWQPLNPPSILGVVHQGLYFFWYDASAIGGDKGGYILDPNPGGFGLIRLDFHAIAAAVNSTDDSLYLVIDQGVIEHGGTPANNDLCQWEGAASTRAVSWTSKLYQLQYPTAYNLCRVRASDYGNLGLELYANGTLFATLMPGGDQEFVIPPRLATRFQFRLLVAASTGNPSVQTVELVERTEELGP